ncbi:MAG: hypothetical protein K2K57_09470 [Oscillospiraceae bacterium]|nr:hypothetical protein [Oscillospiraceae bacterium]
MPEFGYKISEMAGAERFFEAERLLDISLDGFEKSNAEFETDGSRRQEYTKVCEDGSEKKVTLIKNVTECGTLVFANFPLKFFRFGGKVFYLWDILPTALMGIFWWGVFPKIMWGLRFGYVQLAAVHILTGIMWFFLCLGLGKFFAGIEGREHRLLRILFVPYRTRLRTQFLLRGGAVTVIALFISSFNIFSGWEKLYLLNRFLRSPIPALIVSVIPFFMKGRKR